MPRGVKEDTITHRIESVTGVLYRLHVLYQPGGTAERTSILRHLEGTAGGEDPSEIVAKLRRWRRYLSRASEMDIFGPRPRREVQIGSGPERAEALFLSNTGIRPQVLPARPRGTSAGDSNDYQKAARQPQVKGSKHQCGWNGRLYIPTGLAQEGKGTVQVLCERCGM